MSVIKTPVGDYRPTSNIFHLNEKGKIYVDPLTWCIQGKYTPHEKFIVSESEVTGQFIDIYPLTIGWIGDLHIKDTISEKIEKFFELCSKINPSVNVIVGDIVNGSGLYNDCTIENEWFVNAWNTMKEKLSNIFWTKGNHDVEPLRHYFYNWFTRLWHLPLRKFDIIGFDTYNEDKVVEGTISACISISDLFYLNRIVSSSNKMKIIFSHHQLDEWYTFSHNILHNVKQSVINIAAHAHSLLKKQVDDIDIYVNGTMGPNCEELILSVLTLYPDGSLKNVNVKGGIEVKKTENSIEIKTGEAVNWENETIKDTIPVRFNIKNVTLLAFVPSESYTSIKYILQEDGIYLEKEVDVYAIGKISVKGLNPIDEFYCLDEAVIRSYLLKTKENLIKTNNL